MERQLFEPDILAADKPTQPPEQVFTYPRRVIGKFEHITAASLDHVQGKLVLPGEADQGAVDPPQVQDIPGAVTGRP